MSDSKVDQALQAVLNDGMSERAASRKFKVHRGNLRMRLKDKKISYLQDRIEEVKECSAKFPEGTLLLYDIHIPHQDIVAVDSAIKYAKAHYEIREVILGGDTMDCESLSKYDKISETASFADEVYATNSFLRKLRDIFPNAKITYIMGNHEERLEKYIRKNAPELADFKELTLPSFLDFDEVGVEFIDNRKRLTQGVGPYRVQGWNIFHGHEFGICPLTNPAKRYVDRAKVNMIVGHIHKTDSSVMTTFNRDLIRCYSVGTLAKLSPDYMPINQWTQGFAIIEHVYADVTSWRTPLGVVHNHLIWYGEVQ